MVGLLLPVLMVDQSRARDGRHRGRPHPTLPGPERRRRHRHHQPRLVVWVLRVHGWKPRDRIRL